MIVVTAPTGNIGRQVVRNLLDADAPVRVIVRDPARLAEDVREHVEIVTGTHRDPEVVTAAFTGADAVFWLVPPDPQATSMHAAYTDFSKPACEALVSQGVARVVSISALGRGLPIAANAGLVTASLAMDDLIASTGVALRALVLPTFMDNWLRQVDLIREHNRITAPVDGDRPNPTCATRDIAATAARLLLDDSWTGQDSVAVLGPEDLSPNEMARIMSEVLHRPIEFHRTPDEEYAAQLRAGGGRSEAMVQAVIDMMVAKQQGLDNSEPRTPEASTPTTFRQWCAEVLAPAVDAR
jgi:uncharacterized protein YbjT (DUF2867 family)